MSTGAPAGRPQGRGELRARPGRARTDNSSPQAAPAEPTLAVPDDRRGDEVAKDAADAAARRRHHGPSA
ncbi:hypothetical protein ACFQV4_23855 [Streptomyces thermocarboxydus]